MLRASLAAFSSVFFSSVFFSPSAESQAAGRRFLERIRARTEDRDAPVSDATVNAHLTAARAWGASAGSFDYLEPQIGQFWAPVTLNRADRLSFYFCSGYAFHTATGVLEQTTDIASVGGC